MQKVIAFLLSILLIFSLCSCKIVINEAPVPDNIPTDNPITEPITPDNKEPENSNKDSDDSQNNKPPKNEQQENPDSPQQTPSTPPEPEPEIPNINEIVANHKALSKEQYYQYSYLSGTEKAVYKEFSAAAEKCQNILNLTKYKIEKTDIKRIYDAFIADNPQYFYISKYSTYVINSSDDTVTEFILQYTDGTVTDSFDDDNKPIKVADRQKINAQIIEFTDKISAILSHIPSNISELEREKAIYDYITDTVIYDKAAEETAKENPNYFSNSFSAYGAACKGTAVCEGYVKLFQYLCYNSGINVTPVMSDKNMQHMWAAVKIDNNWYMSDITWDDTDDELICTYKYFNVTTLKMSADHSFGTDLKVPLCNSDKASFYNNYALKVTDNALPQNYKEIIKNSDKYIYIYRGESSLDLKDFINAYIYNGEIEEYIKGLDWTLSSTYYHTDTYYFIPIIKK